MHVTVHTAYQQKLSKHLPTWQKRRSRRLSAALLEAVLLLLRLNLDPLIPMLSTLYSPAPRGRSPFDPTCMLRALLLMSMLRSRSIELFAQDLSRQPRLALIAGFEPFATPSVGAVSLFIDRLEDGPYQPFCPHRVQPSQLRQGRHLRNLKQEKVTKGAARKHILAQCDSITQQLKDQSLLTALPPRPDGLDKRLEDALI